jgi:flagellar hook-associated protein 2
MAISAQGIGSGLDVNAIVSQLGAIERQGLKPLQTKASTLQTQLSLYGKIKSQASSLADAAANLALPTAWNAAKATSSNPNAIGVTTTSGALASSLSIEVSQLARAQSSATQAEPAGALIGADGTLTISLGTWTDGATQRTFSADASKTAVNISVASTDTLTTLAEKINSSSAGVTASVLKDGNTERLMMRSTSTGAASGFAISTNATTGSLDRFSLNSPVSTTATDGSSTGMFISQTALSAQVKINGISVSSEKNTIENALPGVTVNLNQVTSTPVEVNVSNDLDSVKSKIQAVLDSYNALNQTLADATKYDAATKKGAPLQGDSMTLGIQSALRGMLGSSSLGSSLYTVLSDVGIERQTDGSLKMNASKMTSALGNLSELQKLFTTNNNDSTTNGFALKVRDFSRGLVAFDGRVTTRTEGIQKSISNNQLDQERVNARADRVEAALRRQYTALDAQMAQMGGLTSFVSSQIAQWNKSTG